jgi:hypothetical protein
MNDVLPDALATDRAAMIQVSFGIHRDLQGCTDLRKAITRETLPASSGLRQVDQGSDHEHRVRIPGLDCPRGPVGVECTRLQEHFNEAVPRRRLI